ncbi:MAG TPA: ABC transporter permease, partial [Vicinamibacterales bacterium]|nr:ABC transporter permease [Vicinamibacterales bacterium]
LPGRSRVIVLSYAVWQSQFAGDRNVIGRTVSVEGSPHHVVGVMRPDFELLGRRADVWMPFPFDRGGSQWKMRAAQGIARLADGVDVAAAGTELRSLAPDWRQALGSGAEWGRDAAAEPLRATSIGETRDPLLLLAGAVGLIVLLTAANLGTLLMGRHVGRLRELGMRTALGATHGRILRQAVVESGVLAVAGAAAGAIAAWLALPAFIALLPADMPRLAAIAVDGPVLATVVMVSVIAVLAFGVAPTLLANRPARLTASLRAGASSAGPAARRALHLLVIGQVALATVIGAGALLLARSLWALGHVPPGFDPARVLTLKIQPAGPDARELNRAVEYYRRVMSAVAAVPGVLQVGAINHLPLSGYNWVAPVRAGDQPLAPGATPPRIGWRMIDGSYFTAMTIPIRAGRGFTALDGPASEQVAVVNDAFAERFFGSPAAAVGRIIQIGFGQTETPTTVVGVVGSVRHTSLAEAPVPEFYRPLAQTLPVAVAVVAKTAGAAGRRRARGAAGGVVREPRRANRRPAAARVGARRHARPSAPHDDRAHGLWTRRAHGRHLRRVRRGRVLRPVATEGDGDSSRARRRAGRRRASRARPGSRVRDGRARRGTSGGPGRDLADPQPALRHEPGRSADVRRARGRDTGSDYLRDAGSRAARPSGQSCQRPATNVAVAR